MDLKVLLMRRESINNGFKTIAYIVTDYINQDGFLNEKEIKYLHKIGCLIGSHSRSHQNLKYLDKEELIKELKISKDILSQITGEEIKDFSLPYGQENGAILKEAKKYYKRIAISKPYFFKKESNILGRISIHSSNHFKHKWVKKVITNNFDLKYFLRIYI